MSAWQCRCGAHNDKAAMACEECGYEPTVAVDSRMEKPVLAMYREVPDRLAQPREPMTGEIKAMLERVKDELSVAAPAVRAKAVEGFKRCPDCENGRLVHLNVRFCLKCYQKL